MTDRRSTCSRRNFLMTSVVTGLTTSLAGRSLAASANDQIGVGFIGCGGRSKNLMQQFDQVDGCVVTGLCDPDQSRLADAGKRYPKAQQWTDLRQLIASNAIDVVVISTCNHWHCLAAIWAMQSGKDVYVEKPLSHSQWEGRQTVNAARKYNRICQVGTQQRSDPMQAEIKQFLHQEKALGEIKSARVNRYGFRRPIGRTQQPMTIDQQVDYDLWLGPAEHRPIFRSKLQYDWHWDWNTGSGEMGNWGVHVLDDVRNNVFQDSVALPQAVLGGGGRVVWDDAGQTPNLHFAYFDTGSIPVFIGLTNLAAEPGGKKSPAHPGPGSGYIAYCEGGRFEGARGRGRAFDASGKLMKEFRGNSGYVTHQANFIEAVRAQDPALLHADVAVGNDSTGWCNLANIVVRVGGQYSPDRAQAVQFDQWSELIQDMRQHAQAHGLSLQDPSISLSPVLSLDTKTEQFVGEGVGAANQLLRRKYRPGYEVPEIRLENKQAISS